MESDAALHHGHLCFRADGSGRSADGHRDVFRDVGHELHALGEYP